jgi:ABC-2 type transport system permease protein
MSADAGLVGAGGERTRTGAIHDIGYQHYDGPRLGHQQIVRALFWHSLRSAFGLGRGAKAKIVPVLVLVVMLLPAAISIFSLANAGVQPVRYQDYLFRVQLPLMVFVAVQAPELVSRDLRNRVLPLYFSRPLKRMDYPLAKYLSMVVGILFLTAVPLIVLYAGSLASVKDGSAMWSQTKALMPGLLQAVLYAVMLAAVSQAIACLSGRRAYATGGIAVFYFATLGIAEALAHIGSPNGPLFHPDTLARTAGILNPITLVEGLRAWAVNGRVQNMPSPGNIGPVYLLVFVVLLGGALAVLFGRYRKASVL